MNKNKLKQILNKIPILYTTTKYLKYIIVRFFIQKAFKTHYLNKNCTLLPLLNDSPKSNFFGYYNISPFNDNNETLTQQTNTNKTRGSLETVVKIFLVRQGINSVKIAESQAWNWQQGSMLQWFNSQNDTIIYNDYCHIQKKYISIIKNINTSETTELCAPIYSVAKTGKFALTLNFERLALMRPDYGYFNNEVSWDKMPDDNEDGIWRIDISTNSKRLILSLEDIKKFKSTQSMQFAKHKVNHIDISPNGKRFMFLHRWICKEGRFMRLLTANTYDGKELYYITGNKMVSHNCWFNNDDIISFCQTKNNINRYVHFTDKKTQETIIADHAFNKDGHPSISPNGNWMLTDTYPDAAGFSSLFVYNIKKQHTILIGKFFQPLKFKGEKRIDLHPKWNKDGKYISIDSGHNGTRKQYIINVEFLKNEHFNN